ncbi:glycosyltransferase family 4 protein [Enterobacter chuandaensis]|uniref:Glycosyltransferase family 1 protein n=1 Tax=Enterobacter chuandaensis TaxID=2497875 RepID=A0AA96M1W5_9ENTR|nr:glycosyltransferase family 1 protein [Enterobacter chuandaensis]MCW4782448.1 glycosyltransferase family 4 protein [Enterobacter chuandaensis]MDA4761810.1 glycosyltransferase family 4 protein [Enterobacter chuandaensis]WNS36494.1 glycosyltransferase family 1 protein [Enterobacter chuandaensis]
MIVNLSRLGKSGTGMWQYSIKFLAALRTKINVEAVICSQTHETYFRNLGFTVLTVPEAVSNTSKTSRIRPLLWFIYSYWLALRIILKFGNAQLVCTTHHIIPFLKNQTITVHDVRPFYYPDSLPQKIYFRLFLRLSIRKCKHILTVSYAVKDKIVSIYNIPSDKVSVIYNCIASQDFIKKHLKKNYFLAVGASWPHKNIHSFIKAHGSWSEYYSLIIVCGRTHYAKFLQEMASDLKLSDKIKFVHEVSFEELKVLYSESKALIYPSFDEGFGIPPIEAMASNTPVIVSDIPVFHEILADSALYVNPDNEISWKNALEEIDKLPREISRFDKFVSKYSFENMEKMIDDWLARLY